ncbi:MAG TPA: hypothetical protein VIF12_00295 [Micavibrio sp.]
MSCIKLIDVTPNPGPHHGFRPPLSLAFDQAWSSEREFYGEGAIKIGELARKAEFSKRNAYCGQEEQRFYKKPGAWSFPIREDVYEQTVEALQIISDHEATFSALYRRKFAYACLRQADLAKGDAQQTSPRWHYDYPVGAMTDHIYFVSDREGTLSQAGPIANAFNRLSSLRNEDPNPDLFTQAEPYGIYLMTSHCAHKSPRMLMPGLRTFLRVIYRGLS